MTNGKGMTLIPVWNKIKGLWSKLKTRARLAALILISLIAVTWLAYMPSGTLVLAVVAPLKDRETEIHQHFAVATARMGGYRPVSSAFVFFSGEATDGE